MDRKQLRLILGIVGLVTVLGCVLPWYTLPHAQELLDALRSANERLGVAANVPSTSISGTHAGFNGTGVLVLGLIGGAAGLVLFLGKEKQTPLDGRQWFFVALASFGVGALLVFLDLVSDAGINAFGGWIAFLATLAGAGLAVWGVRGAPKVTATAPPEGPGDAGGD
jgi:4-amino-4-deoxy-L-arabinose transferase-like glycosyltransferase